jgi:ADP-heptose:LPS heptosyltransferase
MKSEDTSFRSRARMRRTFHDDRRLDPEGVRKIAVLRANALGDFIFSLPALEALKRHFHRAELVYLGRNWHREFLQDRPGPVDRVVAVPPCQGMQNDSDRMPDPQTVATFSSDMRREAFDIVFQMHGGGGNSNPFVNRLGAALTVGLQADNAPPLDINIPYYLYQPEILRYLEVACAAGADVHCLAPRLVVTFADNAALAGEFSVPGTPLIVLHPGATDVRRRWPAE